jgi:hypothetical protein
LGPFKVILGQMFFYNCQPIFGGQNKVSLVFDSYQDLHGSTHRHRDIDLSIRSTPDPRKQFDPTPPIMVSYSTHANSFTIEIKSIPDAGATMSMMKTGMAAGFGIKHTMTMLTNASGNAKEVKRIAWVFAQALKGRRVKMEMLVCAKIISRQC